MDSLRRAWWRLLRRCFVCHRHVYAEIGRERHRMDCHIGRNERPSYEIRDDYSRDYNYGDEQKW